LATLVATSLPVTFAVTKEPALAGAGWRGRGRRTRNLSIEAPGPSDPTLGELPVDLSGIEIDLYDHTIPVGNGGLVRTVVGLNRVGDNAVYYRSVSVVVPVSCVLMVGMPRMGLVLTIVA